MGFPANALILFITMYNWHKRSASSWLVINLALADLLLVVNAFITVYDNDQKKKSRLIADTVAFPKLRCAYKENVRTKWLTIKSKPKSIEDSETRTRYLSISTRIPWWTIGGLGVGVVLNNVVLSVGERYPQYYSARPVFNRPPRNLS